ncbi:PREDICTED: probable signal peptidase complex subunit 2 [Amphimedon queenslandica]|uniref:Signal peptidase complex subunit 2 n=1 Tax=Amphimedon queenslandica TaxID=400682 RepID=A0AAN0IIF3_AMPQE|nr:PREDICTED: probable signal peptidase complex subunit 2 [Amphimedon queenslandica]|eukprot:XP_003390997.2 PREDICTED: probable signal peptidase complex subunit 2 [Amphimedon queenslandica]
MAASDKRKDFMAEDYEPVNIDKWDGNAVKNSIDDNIKNLLKKEYNYTEDFTLVDQRLILCTVACLLSLFAVVYDYFYPFPSSKYVLASCSISYFVVSGLLTLFSSYREKNIFMTGVQRGIAGLGPNDYIYVSSSLPKYNHMYTLQFKFIDGKNNRETTKSIER